MHAEKGPTALAQRVHQGGDLAPSVVAQPATGGGGQVLDHLEQSADAEDLRRLGELDEVELKFLLEAMGAEEADAAARRAIRGECRPGARGR